jgi:hypothetical protein
MERVCAIIVGLLILSYVALGIRQRKAFLSVLGGFCVSRHQEPFGYWLTITIQCLMGGAALIHGILK